MALIDELQQLERAGWEALTTESGADFYRDLMTDDAVMVVANGSALGRDDVIETLQGSEPWQRFDITDVSVVPVTDDVAVLHYRVMAFRSPEAEAFAGRLASTYVRQGDGWKLAFHQQTSVPAVEP